MFRNFMLIIVIIGIVAACSGKTGIDPIMPGPSRTAAAESGLLIITKSNDVIAVDTFDFEYDMDFDWDGGLIIENSDVTVYDFRLLQGFIIQSEPEPFVFGIIETDMVTPALELPLEEGENTFTIFLQEEPYIEIDGYHIHPPTFSSEIIAIAPDGTEYVANEVLLGFVESTPASTRHQIINDYDLFLVGHSSGSGLHVCRFYDDRDPFDVVDELSLEQAVVLPEINGIVRTTTYFPNDFVWNPIYGDEYCWAMKRIQAHHAWDFYKDGVLDNVGDATVDNVVLVIADTGVYYNHPDLGIVGSRLSIYQQHSKVFISDFSDTAEMTDHHGHGTMVAGIAAATGNNGIGLAGVVWNPYIISLKCLNNKGFGTFASVASSLEYLAFLAGHPAAEGYRFIANYSLGSKKKSDWVEISAATAHSEDNTLLIAAAGNNQEETEFYPASYDSFMSVGASSKLQVQINYVWKDIEVYDACPEHPDMWGGTKKWGTNWHNDVDVCAPGSASSSGQDANITTTSFPDNLIFPIDQTVNCPTYNCGLPYYCEHFLGTSAAAPHVTGLAALLWSKYPEWKKEFDPENQPPYWPEDKWYGIKERIEDTADEMFTSGKQLGHGRINAFRALPKGYPLRVKREGSWGDNIGYGITALLDGSVAVTGLWAGKDIFVARYFENNDWELIDHIKCDEPDDGKLPSTGYGVATLSNGNIVVTGRFHGEDIKFGEGHPNPTELSSVGKEDIFVARYDSNDELVWAISAGGELAYTFGRDITVLSDDSIVITGRFKGTVTFGPQETYESTWTEIDEVVVHFGDVFVARYNSNNGNLIWVKHAPGYHWDQGLGITSLSDDSVVLTGFFRNEITFGGTTLNGSGGDAEDDPSPRDIFVARYLSNGDAVWAKHIGGDDDNSGLGITSRLINGQDESVSLTGWFHGRVDFCNSAEYLQKSGSGSEMFIASYDTNGNFQWAKAALSPGSAKGYDITALSDGSLVATGYYTYQTTFGYGEDNETLLSFWTTTQNENIFITRYNHDGSVFWARRAGGAGASAIGHAITTSMNNSVALAGEFSCANITFGEGKFWAERTIEYAQASGYSDIFVTGYAP